MVFSIRIFLVEPEVQSIFFLLANLLVLIYALVFVVSKPYLLIYFVAHFVVFYLINKRIAAGRFYASNKNLNNRTVVVTGAATGIGRVTALELAKLQARVIVGIRGQQRAERVAQELSKESHGDVVGYHLDLSDLASIKTFAEKIDKVDILINNAGVFRQHQELTKDGLETTFGTNHIGHFYLTQLLLPLLIQSKGRIVNLSSIMHAFVNETVDFSKSKSYNSMLVYAKSKLANILHIVELHRRYGSQGIRAYSLHPGGIMSTELNREKTSIQAFVFGLFNFISKTIAQGAMTTLFCALSSEARPGKYHSNCRVTKPSSVAYNLKKAQELWDLSEKIIHDKTK